MKTSVFLLSNYRSYIVHLYKLIIKSLNLFLSKYYQTNFPYFYYEVYKLNKQTVISSAFCFLWQTKSKPASLVAPKQCMATPIDI